jgi:hypothetical protein
MTPSTSDRGGPVAESEEGSVTAEPVAIADPPPGAVEETSVPEERARRRRARGATGDAVARAPRWFRPGRIVLIVVALVVAGTTLAGFETHARLRQTGTDIARTRVSLSTSRRALHAAEVQLATVTAQRQTVRRAVVAATTQLAALRAELVSDEKSIYIQGVSIYTLQTCLDGVDDALNLIAINDTGEAVAALNQVQASCAAVDADAG